MKVDWKAMCNGSFGLKGINMRMIYGLIYYKEVSACDHIRRIFDSAVSLSDAVLNFNKL